MSTSSRTARFPLAGLIATWGLIACQTTPSPDKGEAAPESAAFEIPADARALPIRADQSLLEILVFRGGPMARMGHNHVIASRHLEGTVYLTPDPSRSRVDIRIPVNELTVDEPGLRAAAGEDFPPAVPQAARDGTRANLLSEAVLDGARHPVITVRATDVRPGGDTWDVGVEITFKDRVYPLRVPVQVARGENGLTARGEFTLNQTALGLRPFSAAMGALVVLDEMRLRFAIVAGDVPAAVTS